MPGGDRDTPVVEKGQKLAEHLALGVRVFALGHETAKVPLVVTSCQPTPIIKIMGQPDSFGQSLSKSARALLKNS